MAGVGMLHVVAALITSHEDGSAIVYSPGFSVGPGVAADITFQTADNPDMGDDVVIDNDNGVTGYTGTMENNRFPFGEDSSANKFFSVALVFKEYRFCLLQGLTVHRGCNKGDGFSLESGSQALYIHTAGDPHLPAKP